MRVAILSESSADSTAIRIIANDILGMATLDVEFPTSLRARGWPSVRVLLPTVIKFLHFRSDAEALLVVADSNHSPLDPEDASSRLGEIRLIIERETKMLPAVPGKRFLKTAVGTPAPAIEAWLLCCERTEVNEANWSRGLATQSFPYSKIDLKRHLYGSERYSLAHETEKMVAAANKIITRLSEVEGKFPIGFGTMAAALRQWRSSD